jgi:hypothetical protein
VGHNVALIFFMGFSLPGRASSLCSGCGTRCRARSWLIVRRSRWIRTLKPAITLRFEAGFCGEQLFVTSCAGGIVFHSFKVFVGFRAVYLLIDMDITLLKDFRLYSMIYLLRIASCFFQARTFSVLLVCSGFLLKFFRWFLRFFRSSVQKYLYLFTVPSGM